MIFAILFLILNIVSGIIVINLLKLKSSKIEAIVFGTLIGIVINAWITFLFGLLTKSLFYSLIVSFTIQIIFVLIFRKKISLREKENFKKFDLILITILFLFSFFLNINAILIPKDGGFINEANGWGDMASHLTFINSFSKADNFPPYYPPYAGIKAGYHFMFNFYSAILNKLGFSLRWCILVPNIFMFFILFFLIYSFAYKITKNRKVGILTIILIIFSGGMWFLEIFKENSINNILLGHFGSSFDKGYFLMNLITTFLAQRAAIFGFSILLFLYYYLIPFIIKKENLSSFQLIFFGIIAGLFPFNHAHSFISLMVIVFVLSLIYKNKKIIYFFIPAVILIIPQMLYIKSQFVNMISFNIGWVSEARSGIFNFLFFWIKNLWFILPMFILGLFITKKDTRIIYLSSFSLFILCNLVKFQPWDFDNLKIFYAWLILITICASESIVFIYEKNKVYLKIIAIVIIVLSITSGFLSIHRDLMNKFQEYNYNDEKIADWINLNIEKKAVFLTADKTNHPVSMLAGRAIFRGYGGWIWSLGILDTRQETVKKIYQGELSKMEIKNYCINYIYIGPEEFKSEEYKINPDYFEKNLNIIYDNNGVKIYRV